MRSRLSMLVSFTLALGLAATGCAGDSVRYDASELPETFDVIVRNGTVYDGSGGPGVTADIGIVGDHIIAVADLQGHEATTEIDATGLAVAPGFINVLSWAVESLIIDGKSQSDIRQGVTLEIFGEGSSMGPLTEAMKRDLESRQGRHKYPIEWTTLGEYLDYLVARGVSTNVASFVGATTVRAHVLGYEDRAPTADELAEMQRLVGAAMEDGALGLGSSLIYAPAFYASTDELIALARTAGAYGGSYVSHLRSESNTLIEAVDELIQIAREADVPAEIYHLKAAGQANWHKLDQVTAKVEEARAEGLQITADMYTYTAGRTGLDAAMPPWVQEGGHEAWVKRLRDPQVRARVAREMQTPTNQWENLYLAAGSAENILFVGFKNPALRELTGKTLAEVSADRGRSPADTAIDLVIEDNSRVATVYFLMDEENIKKKIALPWMSFGSDEASLAPEGVFMDGNPHPRGYGNFARLLGRYVRDEKVISLSEAVRKLTSLPADNFSLAGRGRLTPGHYADVVVFDPLGVQDHATFDKPHRYSAGMAHVFVNGVHVLADGEHTGAKPGQVVFGPGYRKKVAD